MVTGHYLDDKVQSFAGVSIAAVEAVHLLAKPCVVIIGVGAVDAIVIGMGGASKISAHNVAAIDGVIGLLYADGCVAATQAATAHSSFQGGGGVKVLLQPIGQHTPYITQVVLMK